MKWLFSSGFYGIFHCDGELSLSDQLTWLGYLRGEERLKKKTAMAAEIHSRPQSSRLILLNKIEGHQDSVTAAILIPKEDGVITVSEDRYERAAVPLTLVVPVG